MKQIYVITSGEDDYYRVDAIYTKKAWADEYVVRFGGNIEESALDPFVEEFKKGNLYFVSFHNDLSACGDPVRITDPVEAMPYFYLGSEPLQWALRIPVWAKDEAEACSLASNIVLKMREHFVWPVKWSDEVQPFDDRVVKAWEACG